MKKKTKKVEMTINLTAVEILAKTNEEVLEHVDNIINEAEKQKTIKELIRQLEITLLDRDAGKKGPKLIDQLKERLNTISCSVKEYRQEDLIWWKGTEGQLIYLFEQLIKMNLIDDTQENRKYILLAYHFRNKNGKRFNNKQMGQAAQNLTSNKNMKPKNAEKIENILKDIPTE